MLSLLLAFVALRTLWQHERATSWKSPLRVAIDPIAADASPATARYLATLQEAQFAPIDRFFAREAARYGVREPLPVVTRLEPRLDRSPPRLAPGADPLATILWSLRLRYFAWTVGRRSAEPTDVRMFVMYRDPALQSTLPHSLGLEKGLVGVVYAFADPRMDGANDVVIAHELMHTLGATDEYDPATDAPLFPDGYGDPRQVPLLPQHTAELMAGRRVIGPGRWTEPLSLAEVVIGPRSARQIRWIR